MGEEKEYLIQIRRGRNWTITLLGWGEKGGLEGALFPNEEKNKITVNLTGGEKKKEDEIMPFVIQGKKGGEGRGRGMPRWS